MYDDEEMVSGWWEATVRIIPNQVDEDEFDEWFDYYFDDYLGDYDRDQIRSNLITDWDNDDVVSVHLLNEKAQDRIREDIFEGHEFSDYHEDFPDWEFDYRLYLDGEDWDIPFHELPDEIKRDILVYIFEDGADEGEFEIERDW